MVFLKMKDMKSRSKMHAAKCMLYKAKKQRYASKKDTRSTWDGLIEDNNITDLSFLNLSPDKFYPLVGTKYSGIERLLYDNQSHKWIQNKYAGERKRWKELKRNSRSKRY